MNILQTCFGILDLSSRMDHQPSLTSSDSCLKDCQANDYFPKINVLPRELLARIFGIIAVVDRRDFRKVCKRWKDIMDTMVGTELRVGTFSEFDPDYDEHSGFDLVYQPITKISEIGVESCLIGNIPDPIDTDGGISSLLGKCRDFLTSSILDVTKPFPNFKSPDLVTAIQFFGRIKPTQFDSLLSELSYLTVISIHLTTLDSLEISVFHKLDIPTLETFVIKAGQRVYDSHFRLYREWNMQKILKNTLVIFQNYFPRLKNAAFEIVYDIAQGLGISTSVFQFLHRHVLTIERFTLQFCLLVNEFAFHTESIENDDPDLLSLTNDLKTTLQLKQLHLVPLCISLLPFNTEWSSIIQEQKSLTKFTVVGVKYRSDTIQTIINNNFLTLTELCLCRIVVYDNQVPMQFDCGIINPCQNLKVLVLRGWTATLLFRNLINADQLPGSLTQIDIGDMAIGTDDIRVLALGMPYLEDLELRFVGNKQEMGMDEDTLREIVRRKQINVCRLQRAFNGKLPDGGIFNDDMIDPDFISESMGGFIGFQKGKRGFYKRLSITTKNF